MFLNVNPVFQYLLCYLLKKIPEARFPLLLASLFISNKSSTRFHPQAGLCLLYTSTIGTVSDDETFEQIKKQLNRMVEVIKVIDFTNMFVRMKEILYIKVFNCSSEDKVELFQIAETFKARVIDYGKDLSLIHI